MLPAKVCASCGLKRPIAAGDAGSEDSGHQLSSRLDMCALPGQKYLPRYPSSAVKQQLPPPPRSRAELRGPTQPAQPCRLSPLAGQMDRQTPHIVTTRAYTAYTTNQRHWLTDRQVIGHAAQSSHIYSLIGIIDHGGIRCPYAANTLSFARTPFEDSGSSIYLSATGNSFPVVFLYWPRMKSRRIVTHISGPWLAKALVHVLGTALCVVSWRVVGLERAYLRFVRPWPALPPTRCPACPDRAHSPGPSRHLRAIRPSVPATLRGHLGIETVLLTLVEAVLLLLARRPTARHIVQLAHETTLRLLLPLLLALLLLTLLVAAREVLDKVHDAVRVFCLDG